MSVLDRRRLTMALAASACSPAAFANPPAVGEDGLHVQPWFLQSLLELKDDLEEATKRGKRFAILWELKGCPYCRDLHEINFADPQIVTYIRERFDVLQLNIIGSREVVDFDGQTLSEKAFAAKYAIRGTPTFQFFGEAAAPLKDKPPMAREVARGNGYMKPKPFLAMFRFVHEKAYEKGTLMDYLKAQG